MKSYSASTKINAPAETVWAILTDAAKYADWDPQLISMEGRIAPGEQLTIVTKLAPNRAFKPKVTEYEANRRMVWASGMPLGLFGGKRTFTLEPQGNDRTKFYLREEFSGPLLALFGGSIPDMDPVFAEFAAALKQRAEAESA